MTHPSRPFLTSIMLAVAALLLPGLTVQGSVSFTNITGDADSGIDSVDTYTHAIDFGNGAPPTVNGVAFVQAFGTAAGGIANSGSRTYGASVHGGNNPPAVSGSIAEVFRDMRYGGPDGGYVELTGLTPGQAYEFRLYDRAWGYDAGTRPVTLSFDINADGSVEFLAPTYNTNYPNDPPVSLIGNISWVTRYAYVAGASGSLKVTFTIGGDGTYHMYGLTNVESGPDEVPPVISRLSPDDNATGVYPGSDLVASFSEDITLTGSGTVSIVNVDAATQQDIALPDGQVTVAGGALTIDLSGTLGLGTNYAVRISTNAIVDQATLPNAFGGITNDTTWNFTTADPDPTAPVITNTVPADDATGVAPNAVLVASFDDGILAGAGNIVIYNVTGSNVLTTIAVSNASQVSIAGTALTITPDVDFSGATEYAVLIDAGAVQNYSGVGFAGMTNTTTWSFSVADTTTFIGANRTNGDNWNVPGNWDLGIPAGVLNAVIPAGKQVTSDGGTAPVYSGNVSLEANAYLQVGWVNPRHLEDFNALGTPGVSTLSMQDGASLHFRAGGWGTVDIPAIALLGDASLRMNSSTEPASNYRFPYGINGPYTFTLFGKGNQSATLTATNTLNELILDSTEGSYDVFAETPLSLNGDVTVKAFNGLPAADLTINASNAMPDTATLALNGSMSATLLTINADDTVSNLVINGFISPAGDYDSARAWIAGSGTLTVLEPADTTPPVFGAFEDDVSGGPIPEATVSLGYTVSFGDLSMDESTIDASDFSNTGTAAVVIGDIVQRSATNFSVEVFVESAGTIQLQINAGADIKDLAGQALDTGSAIPDDTIITVTTFDPPTAPLRMAVTNDGYVSWVNGGAGTLNASGSDKLVVVVSGEHHFPNNPAGNVTGITYDGEALSQALEIAPNIAVHGQTSTDIWYLDAPGDYHTLGSIVVSFSGNNWVATAIGLSGTAEGVGAIGASAGASALKLAISNESAIVISSIGMGGRGNTAGPLPGVLADAPASAVTVDGINVGAQYAGHAVAKTEITAQGVYTFSFNTANTDVATLAAEFPGQLIIRPNGALLIVR